MSLNKIAVAAFIFYIAALVFATVYDAKKPVPIPDATEPRTVNIEQVAIADPCGLIDVVCEGEAIPSIEERIRASARYYGVDGDTAVRIAKCESTLNPYARNGMSSARGLYQFTDTTWWEINAPGDQFDVDESIKQFMIWYKVHPEWWQCE